MNQPISSLSAFARRAFPRHTKSTSSTSVVMCQPSSSTCVRAGRRSYGSSRSSQLRQRIFPMERSIRGLTSTSSSSSKASAFSAYCDLKASHSFATNSHQRLFTGASGSRYFSNGRVPDKSRSPEVNESKVVPGGLSGVMSDGVGSGDEIVERHDEMMGWKGALKFEAEGCLIPHPRKVKKGGEDSLMVGDRHLAVADGVGGWEQVGVDSGKFSKELMYHLRTHTLKTESWKTYVSPINTMTWAVKRTRATGSSTCCLAFLDRLEQEDDGPARALLRTANLGDSGLIVFRTSHGKCIHQTEEQLHDFNFPRQLGTGCTDTPADSDQHEVVVHEGDVVVLATDGVWDNVFVEEIERILLLFNDKPVADIAQTIALMAFEKSADSKFISPFCVKEFEHFGAANQGGKPDDISVVVARVINETKPLSEVSFLLEHRNVLTDRICEFQLRKDLATDRTFKTLSGQRYSSVRGGEAGNMATAESLKGSTYEQFTRTAKKF